VLKASHKTNSSSSNKTTNNNKVIENGVKETNGLEKKSEETNGEPPEKKRRILEKIHYEDLEAGSADGEVQELKLSKVRFYASIESVSEDFSLTHRLKKDCKCSTTSGNSHMGYVFDVS
jgi:hypothetical protein